MGGGQAGQTLKNTRLYTEKPSPQEGETIVSVCVCVCQWKSVWVGASLSHTWVSLTHSLCVCVCVLSALSVFVRVLSALHRHAGGTVGACARRRHQPMPRARHLLARWSCDGSGTGWGEGPPGGTEPPPPLALPGRRAEAPQNRPFAQRLRGGNVRPGWPTPWLA